MKAIKNAILATLALASIGLAAAEEKLGLGGNCPVCYIAVEKAAPGKESITSVHEGITYRFVDEATKATFEADPTKYLPQYGGYCAYGMSLGKKFESDPNVFKVVDGRLFLNLNEEIGEKFSKDTAAKIEEADKQWAELMKKK